MRRQVHMPLYAVLVLATVATLGPVGSTVASVKVAERNRRVAAEVAMLAEARQREATRLESCALFGKLIDTYEETPPTTPAGKNVEQAYRDYYNTRLLCVPPRLKEKR